MANDWLREHIAFAIFNDTNPPLVRDALTLQNIEQCATVRLDIGDGYTMEHDFKMGWSMNRDSFLALADVAIAAFEKADEDGSA